MTYRQRYRRRNRSSLQTGDESVRTHYGFFLRMANSITPRMPPPSRLRILMPAVGGTKLNRALLSDSPQNKQESSMKVYFSDLDGVPKVCTQVSQNV